MAQARRRTPALRRLHGTRKAGAVIPGATAIACGHEKGLERMPQPSTGTGPDQDAGQAGMPARCSRVNWQP